MRRNDSPRFKNPPEADEQPPEIPVLYSSAFSIYQRYLSALFISVIYQRSTSISVQRDPPDSTGTLDVHHLPDALPECKYALHKWLA